MLEFILASILIELTPGPNMTWLAVLGATQGRKTALFAVAGICLGLTIAAIVAGTGLTALLYQFPPLTDALRWAGTLYLLYLAWDAWQDADDQNEATGASSAQAFRNGLISNILNPKAYLFYAAMLPQFLDAASNTTTQIARLSAIYVVIATAIHSGIAIASGGLAGWLANSPQAITLRKILAIALVATAAWFFYSTGVLQ